MSDREDMVYTTLATAYSTSRYFLMGVLASAMAFAFHETATWKISNSLYVVGGAALIWGVGFVAGIRTNTLSMRVTSLNLKHLIMQRIARGLPAEYTAEPLSEVDHEMRRTNDRVPIYSRLLEISIPLGAAVYGVGHVLHLLGK